jgi:hypothetical protein
LDGEEESGAHGFGAGGSGAGEFQGMSISSGRDMSLPCGRGATPNQPPAVRDSKSI